MDGRLGHCVHSAVFVRRCVTLCVHRLARFCWFVIFSSLQTTTSLLGVLFLVRVGRCVASMCKQAGPVLLGKLL